YILPGVFASASRFSVAASRASPALHSFPTRRSSDLFRQARVIGGAFNTAQRDILACRHIVVHEILKDDANLTAQRVDVIFAKIEDRKSTRLNSSHRTISYAVFCLKKKKL